MQTTPQKTAAEALAAALEAAAVPTDNLGSGVIETWIDTTRDGHHGTVRLHVAEDGASVDVAVTFYDLSDEDQPGRPVDDEDVGTFPVDNVSGILHALQRLAT